MCVLKIAQSILQLCQLLWTISLKKKKKALLHKIKTFLLIKELGTGGKVSLAEPKNTAAGFCSPTIVLLQCWQSLNWSE